MAQGPYRHPPIEEVTLCDVLDALSDPLRLSILQALVPGRDAAWNSFAGGIAPSTLSYHMEVLRGAGLITSRREGTRCLVLLRSDFEKRFPGLLALVLMLGQAEGERQPTRAVMSR